MTSPGGRIPSERLLEVYFRAGLLQGVELMEAAIEEAFKKGGDARRHVRQAVFRMGTRIKCYGVDVSIPKLHDVETSSVDEAGGRRSQTSPSKGRRSTSSKKAEG